MFEKPSDVLIACILFAGIVPFPGLRAQQVQDPTMIYKNAAPAVVLVENIDPSGKVKWSGTGFFVTSDGKLITNYHVIDHAQRLRVRRTDGTAEDVVLIFTADKKNDLALLKFETTGVPYLPLACDRKPEIGATVFTIGNPLGMLENTFSEGIVSGFRDVGGRDLLQTSAPISHGNSGGPLLDKEGAVVGITTATIGEGQNLNFAVPVGNACEMIALAGEPTLLASLFAADLQKDETVTPGNQSGQPAMAIDQRWLSSDPRSVLADPHFYDLGIPEREKVLIEIDPQFRSLSSEKRHSYLWNAETDNLPKPLPAKNTYVWALGNPTSKLELSKTNELTKVVDVNRVEVAARIPLFNRIGSFFEVHIRITNKSTEPVNVIPQTFFVRAIAGRDSLLRFEYPERIFYELSHRMIRAELSGRLNAPQDVIGDMNKMVISIPAQAIKQTTLGDGETVEGEAYFETPEKKMREFVLNVFVGQDAFQIPFTLAR
jgi:hypothetical protein